MDVDEDEDDEANLAKKVLLLLWRLKVEAVGEQTFAACSARLDWNKNEDAAAVALFMACLLLQRVGRCETKLPSHHYFLICHCSKNRKLR
jgi:hypothetical protein